MEKCLEDNNRVLVSGELHSIEYSHSLYGEAFYSCFIDAARLSGTADSLPVTISERIMPEFEELSRGKWRVSGQLRSYNKQTEGACRLVLTVFARELERAQENAPDQNEIQLDGFLCKSPVFRTTPFSREITDMLVAVNRSYNRSDYLPCIAWGRNARYASMLEVGSHVRLRGRVQSRAYQKQLLSGDIADRIAYEVSLSSLERL